MKRTPKTLQAALLAIGFATAVPSAYAVDWTGYFRAGPGATKKDASRACYGLPGAGLKYRLGNECDFYGEFLLSQNFKAEGVDYKVGLMTNFQDTETHGEVQSKIKQGVPQLFVEGRGYDVAPDVTFWAGKRFYGRADVHIVDTFFTKLDGVGAGAEIPFGGAGAKVALAYFKKDDSSTESGNRFNVDVSGIDVNPGGKLRVLGTAVQGNFTGGKSGAGLTVQHNQADIFGAGSSNVLWVQYAQGSAGLDGNFGVMTADSSVKEWRVAESFSWQKGAFGGQALAMWEQDKANVAGLQLKQTNLSIGGRVSYGLTRNFKLLGELGHSQIKVQGFDAAHLTKFTFAPTLSTGPGFSDRPELRLYVTSAKWNTAAGNVTGQPAFDNKTSGTSYGVQVEVWF
jgi:maltoporin